ncbi:MAG: hypothetical protein J1E29_07045 [Duncaniella sp.]|nr:hypothetical protein [Duncaniella sp.]
MKSPIIIRSRIVPKGICINIFGTFWARDTRWIDKYVINHERIHTAQMRELLFIPFYILYLIEWFVRIVQYRNWNMAYLNISFEREAYANGKNIIYLSSRPRFAWIKYLTTQKPH